MAQVSFYRNYGQLFKKPHHHRGKVILERFKRLNVVSKCSLESPCVLVTGEYGRRNWSLTSKEFLRRSKKSCGLRWCNQLSPPVEHQSTLWRHCLSKAEGSLLVSEEDVKTWEQEFQIHGGGLENREPKQSEKSLHEEAHEKFTVEALMLVLTNPVLGKDHLVVAQERHPLHFLDPPDLPRNLCFGKSDLEKSLIVELTMYAMEELVRMADTDEPLWMKNVKDSKEVLSLESYGKLFQ